MCCACTRSEPVWAADQGDRQHRQQQHARGSSCNRAGLSECAALLAVSQRVYGLHGNWHLVSPTGVQGFAVGMDAALQINPYYGKTSMAGLREHFKWALLRRLQLHVSALFLPCAALPVSSACGTTLHLSFHPQCSCCRAVIAEGPAIIYNVPSRTGARAGVSQRAG